MTHEKTVDAGPSRLLIVGGNCDAAKALRRRLCGGGHYRLNTLVVKDVDVLPDENIIFVEDYFTPGPGSLENIDVIVNFADLVNATAEELYYSNVIGPTRLAIAARAAGVKHFLHISSLSVYGGAEDITASTRPAPISEYGKSKLSGDQALAELSSQSFAVTSLRVPILYGVSGRSKLHKLAKAMTFLRLFPVPGVQQPRSILHFENLAGAIEVLLDTKIGGVRFAADPHPFTFNSLADGIARRDGRRPRFLIWPEWIFRLARTVKSDVYSSLYARSLIEKDSLMIITAEKTPEQCIDDIVLRSRQPY